MKNQNTALAFGLVLIGAAGIWLIPPLAALFWSASAASNPEQWLGFLGNLVGAAATLLAAGIALYAAYRTITPVKRQLAAIVKQNDHIAYDKLSKRAVDLNDELNLLTLAAANANVVDLQIQGLRNWSNPRDSFARVEDAMDRYTPVVESLQNFRGKVWGDKSTQESRDTFIDACLVCASAGNNVLQATRTFHQTAAVTSKPAFAAWDNAFKNVETRAQPVYELITAETKKVRIAIGALEERVFNR